MRTSTIRWLCTAGIGALPILALSSPAHAGGAISDQDLRMAYVQWLDTGGVPGMLGGNVYRGVVAATDDLATPGLDAPSGRLEAWTCPPGVEPPALGEVGNPEAPPTECAFEGARDLDLDSGVLSVRPALTGARLVGSARAIDPAGVAGPTAVGIDLTFTATSPLVTDTLTNHWVDETGRPHTARVTVARRDAQATGWVGSVAVGSAAQQLTDLGSQVDRIH
ncbi:hypothetical protein ACWEOW_24600 [Monashia sp. NPDC004114]